MGYLFNGEFDLSLEVLDVEYPSKVQILRYVTLAPRLQDTGAGFNLFVQVLEQFSFGGLEERTRATANSPDSKWNNPEVYRGGSLPWLRPDGRVQVTVEYEI